MSQTKTKVDPAAAALELLKRKRSQTSLHSFALNIDIPGAPMQALCPDEDLLGPASGLMADIHSVMLTHIERTMNTPFGRLMIFAPPGSAKSSYTSVVAPAWDAARPRPTHPNAPPMWREGDGRLIIASYAGKIAQKQSRRMQQICKSQRYMNMWDEPVLVHKDAVGDWSLSNKCEVLADGIMGGITGNRCFPQGTAVLTPDGCVNIEHLYPSCRVLSYDHENRKIVTSRVAHAWNTKRKGLVEVTTAAGRRFRCTADHPVFVEGRGYIEAAVLRTGDLLKVCDVPDMQRDEAARIKSLPGVLRQDTRSENGAALCVLRKAGSPAQIRVGQTQTKWQKEGVLLKKMYGAALHQNAGETLRTLWRICQAVWSSQKRSLLQHGVSSSCAPGETQNRVPSLFSKVCAAVVKNAILFTRLCKRSAQFAHDWEWEFTFQNRNQLCNLVSVNAPLYPVSRRSQLRRLLAPGQVGSAPRRPQTTEQSPRELDNSLQGLPLETPQEQSDSVSLVRQVCDEENTVYDIEVEGSHNFFAEEVLVHNCHGVIIDDPVAGREEADSEQLRQKTIDGYNDDVMTRLLPGAYVILVQTRWHEADLAGQILPDDYDGRSGWVKCKDGMNWYVLNIPAKAERGDDPLGRQSGEYIWPEWFTPQHWAMYENGTTREQRRTWTSLYQQRPTPEGAGDFKREDFNWYDPGEEPMNLHLYGASDYAVTEKGGDFSEHGVGGLDGDGNLWFVDWWSGQELTDVSIEAFIKLVIDHNPLMWVNEGGVIDKAVRPAINKAMREARDGLGAFVDLRTLPSIADKRAKAIAFGARVSAGSVWLPRGKAWAEDLVTQCVAAPAGRYDDKYDVGGLFGRMIDQLVSAKPPPAARRQGIKPFTAAWLEHEEPKALQVRYR